MEMLLSVTLNPAIDLYIELPGWQFGGEVNRARSVRRVLGGKGINMSRTAAALGADTRAIMLAGEETGPALLRLIEGEPFAIDTVKTRGEMRTNIHILNVENGDSLKVNQSGDPVGDVLDELKTCFRVMIKSVGIVAMGGSLPPGCPVSIYGELCAIANNAGVPVILDAEKEPLMKALASRPAIVKPNGRELGATLSRELPTERDVIAAARELQDRGAAAVIVTDGGRPTIAAFGEQIFRVHPPEVNVVHPTGAGDAFTGALAAALEWEWTVEEALRLSAAAGAAACLGEQVDLAKEIEDLVKKVKVEVISGT